MLSHSVFSGYVPGQKKNPYAPAKPNAATEAALEKLESIGSIDELLESPNSYTPKHVRPNSPYARPWE